MKALIYFLRKGKKVQADTTYGGLYHEISNKGHVGTPYEWMKYKAHTRQIWKAQGVWVLGKQIETPFQKAWNCSWSGCKHCPGTDREVWSNI